MGEYDGITEDDKLYARQIIAAFFGESYASQFTNINEDVVEVIGEMLDASADCTEWMDYVPKPVPPIGPRPGIKWALRKLRKVGKALMSNPSGKHNFTCKTFSAMRFKQALQMAAMGI